MESESALDFEYLEEGITNLSLGEGQGEEFPNDDVPEEDMTSNFVIIRHLAGLLTGEKLMRFREVCRHWNDWSIVWFKNQHPIVSLETSHEIEGFCAFLKGRTGRIPFTRITITGRRNQVSPELIRDLFMLIGEDIRHLSLPKSRIYHLTEDAAYGFAMGEDGIGPPMEPWNKPHYEAAYLQLTPNLTHLEIGIGFLLPIATTAQNGIPPLHFLRSLQLNFEHDSFDRIQASCIEEFILRTRSLRRIHFYQTNSSILPLVERTFRQGMLVELTLVVFPYQEVNFPDYLFQLSPEVQFSSLSLQSIPSLKFGPQMINLLQNQASTLEKLCLVLHPARGVPATEAVGPPVLFPVFPKLENLSLGVRGCPWHDDQLQFPMQPMTKGQFPCLKTLDLDAQLGFPTFAHREMEKLEKLELRSYNLHVPFSAYAPNLTSLTIPNFQNHEVQNQALRHILTGFPKLEILDLNLMLPSETVNDTLVNPPPNPEIWNIFTGGATPRGIKTILKLRGSTQNLDEEHGKGLEQLKALRRLNLVWCGNEGLKAILFLSVTGKLHRLSRIQCRTQEEPPSPKLERRLKRFHDTVNVATWRWDDGEYYLD